MDGPLNRHAVMIVGLHEGQTRIEGKLDQLVWWILGAQLTTLGALMAIVFGLLGKR